MRWRVEEESLSSHHTKGVYIAVKQGKFNLRSSEGKTFRIFSLENHQLWELGAWVITVPFAGCLSADLHRDIRGVSQLLSLRLTLCDPVGCYVAHQALMFMTMLEMLGVGCFFLPNLQRLNPWSPSH